MEKYSCARRGVRWLSFALVLICGPAELSTARAAANSNGCVGFKKGEADHELLYHAKNSCKRELECSMNYTLRCEDDKGAVTSTAEQQVAFQLASKGEHALTLSAASCSQGWTIGDVAWNCF